MTRVRFEYQMCLVSCFSCPGLHAGQLNSVFNGHQDAQGTVLGVLRAIKTWDMIYLSLNLTLYWEVFLYKHSKPLSSALLSPSNILCSLVIVSHQAVERLSFYQLKNKMSESLLSFLFR